MIDAPVTEKGICMAPPHCCRQPPAEVGIVFVMHEDDARCLLPAWGEYAEIVDRHAVLHDTRDRVDEEATASFVPASVAAIPCACPVKAISGSKRSGFFTASS